MIREEQYQNLLSLALEAALKAGEEVMKFYKTDDLAVELKSDLSPVTQADKVSSGMIRKILAPSKFPILSEEETLPTAEERSGWTYYWCVDPLDGTKEFIRKNDDFAINIALMEEDYPIMGMIYLPVHQTVYFGGEGYGAFRSPVNQQFDLPTIIASAERLPLFANRTDFIIAGSHSHLDAATKEHIEQVIRQKGEGRFLVRGSSVKLCLLAEGSADYYPRMSHIMEWDVAAGHAICEAAGCRVTDWEGTRLHYNRPDFYLSWFKVYREDKKW